MGGATSDPSDLQIRIVDDTPLAVNDAGGTVTEDGAGSINGNVLTNDIAGADAPKAFDAWAAGNADAITALNTYGTLTLNNDGTWSYVLNNSLAATQALTAADNLSYDLNYTMKDADGDPSSAKLTIVIQGADDSQTVTVEAVGGDTTTVYETALADGRNELSDPALNSDPREAVSGTFTAAATDGIASITVGGISFTLAQLSDAAYLAENPIDTGEGTLLITSYSSADGNLTASIGYTYTLKDNIINATPEATFFDDTGNLITVTGVGGATSDPSDLQIRIVDDVPAIGDFVDFTVPNAIGETSGPTNVGFLSGADNWSSINITGEPIDGLTYKPLVTNPDGSATLSAYATGGDPDDLVFSYTVYTDGSQSFNLLKPEAETQITQSLSNLSPGGPTPFLEIPSYEIEFSGTGSGVNSSTQGMGISNQFIGNGETLTLEFYNPGLAGDDVPDNISGPANATERLINSLNFTNNSNGGGTLNWIVYNTVDGTTDSGSVTEVNGHYLIDAAIDFNKIEITGGADANARLTSVVISERLLPDGEDITFTVTGTDGDGDITSSDDVTVTILPGVAADAFAQEFSLQDSTVHNATGAAETLLATDDSDVFVWSLADQTAQGDSIVGFNTAADAINIADILADSVNTTDFSSYLDVSLDGASTVLRVSSTGDFAHADQVITVQDVNLFEGVNFNDSAALATALQNMVDAGKLITD